MESDPIPKLQVLVRLLNGSTAVLRFTSPQISVPSLKERILDLTRIPSQRQRLVSGVSELSDGSVVSGADPTVHLLLRLPGGKGGFGSLLRGAATKAGQKKTNNFDACRDMSGRRLRHVNAEKRLEDWKAEEDARNLERIAEDFIKTKAKKGKRGLGDGAAHQYVLKYREDSAKCVARVQDSVREAMLRKRKATEEPNKLKIRKGKRIVGEADDMDEYSSDDEQEEDKSIVFNSGNHLDVDKEKEGSSGSVPGVKQEGGLSGGSSGGQDILAKENSVIEPVSDEDKVAQIATVACPLPAVVSGTEPIQSEAPCPCPSSSGNGASVESEPIQAEVNRSSESKSGIQEEAVNESPNTVELVKPLDFGEFNSAAEMEVLGMERLKSELQAHGLKCGGTLQERAARLFLLKSTPLDKLPKKLLAKK